MSRRNKFDVRKLLSGHRAIISTEGLYRLQFMPSGRIMEEMVAPESAKIIMDTFNGCTSPDSIHTERLMAITYEEIFASNKKLMKRREKFLKKRKAGRKGGAA